MKPALLISCVAALLFSCKQQRSYQTNTNGYDVVNEKSYVLRAAKPTADSMTDSVLKRRAEFMGFFERHGFKRVNATKDSLAFVRSNGQSVLIELPSAEDAWQSNLIIIFDPQKNPLFINLHKDTTQAENYLKQ
jgi:hypothetical protein